MKSLKRLLKHHRRVAAAMQAGVMVLAHNRAASNMSIDAPPLPEPKPPKSKKDQTGAFNFSDINDTREFVAMANAVWDLGSKLEDLQKPLDSNKPEPAIQQPTTTPSEIDSRMTPQQAKLWLQAYNAGPYALLKYKGNVPYRETQNYAPRVFKYYRQDLSKTPYEPYIQAAAKKYGLDPQLIRAVMKTESDFDNATVSHAGARGLMQVMPVVWKDIGERYGLAWEYQTGVFEPEKNIEVACAYLAWLRYDFLPRHFAEFELNPKAPVAMIRDNAPPRTTPRILASAQPTVGNLLAEIAKSQVAKATNQNVKIKTGPATKIASASLAQNTKSVTPPTRILGAKDQTKASSGAAKAGAAQAVASNALRPPLTMEQKITKAPLKAAVAGVPKTKTPALAEEKNLTRSNLAARSITPGSASVAGKGGRVAVRPSEVRVASQSLSAGKPFSTTPRFSPLHKTTVAQKSATKPQTTVAQATGKKPSTADSKPDAMKIMSRTGKKVAQGN